MKQLLCIGFLFGLCVSCGSNSSASDRHYQLTGEVKALDAKQHVANVNAAAIPNYMEAMDMDYPIKSEAEFKALHVGEHISATVNVHSDDSYDLSNVRPSAAKK